jgi:hypothetical protein
LARCLVTLILDVVQIYCPDGTRTWPGLELNRDVYHTMVEGKVDTLTLRIARQEYQRA